MCEFEIVAEVVRFLWGVLRYGVIVLEWYVNWTVGYWSSALKIPGVVALFLVSAFFFMPDPVYPLDCQQKKNMLLKKIIIINK